MAPTQDRLGGRLRLRHRLHGHRPGRPHPEAHRRRPRRRTVPGLAAVHQLHGGDGRGHAHHGMGLQRAWAPSAPCSPAWRSSSSAPAWPGRRTAIGGIVGFRAVWGLGNALFIATALATIVCAARGSVGPGDHPVRGRAGPRHRRRAAGRRRAGVHLLARPVLRRLRPDGDRPRSPPSFVLPATPATGRRTSLGRAAARPSPPRPAPGRGADGAAVQLRLLHAAGLHAVPAAICAAPDRAHLLRLGPAARLHVRGGRPAAAAPVRHAARLARRAGRVRRRSSRPWPSAPTTSRCWSSASSSPARSSASTTPSSPRRS